MVVACGSDGVVGRGNGNDDDDDDEDDNDNCNCNDNESDNDEKNENDNDNKDDNNDDGDDDAKERTKYHADPEEDVAPRAANSSSRFILFAAPPSIILTPLPLRVPPL